MIKTIHFENNSKQHPHDRINELIIQGKIIKQPNRNDDSYRVNESIDDFIIEQLEYSNLPASDLSFATPNIKQPSSTESVNAPRYPINNIPEIPNLPQKDINSKEELSNQKHSMTTYLKK